MRSSRMSSGHFCNAGLAVFRTVNLKGSCRRTPHLVIVTIRRDNFDYIRVLENPNIPLLLMDEILHNPGP